MTVLAVDDILDVITSTQTPTTHGNAATRQCYACGESLSLNVIECPVCGIINLDTPRRRQDSNRPTRQRLTIMESENLNGRYIISRNSDGSLSCDCLSFLFQRGVENGVGYTTCKHIRMYLSLIGNEITERLHGARKPSEWQIAALKRLGVSVNDHLTDAQAYFIFNDLLIKQGVDYREYESLLREHRTVNLLPIYQFGVEFEGGIHSDHGSAGLSRKLVEAGVICRNESYNHSVRAHWKIVSDGSVHVDRNYFPIELVSRKLYGKEGFEELKTALGVWNELGASVNRSCGTHVHIDAWNWGEDEMMELAKIWAKIEIPVLWYLVSPSRRNNNFCKPVDMNYFINLVQNGPARLDRYYSLNLSAFGRHKTIEFRLHNGTLDAKKIIPWIIFCLKLTDSVKKGLKYTDIQDVTFDSVMNAVGMNSSSTSVIKDARDYLYGRFQHWKEDSERNPDNMPHINPVNIDEIQEELDRRAQQMRERELRVRYDSRRRPRYNPPAADSNLPPTSVRNLASASINRSLPGFDIMRQAQRDDNTWELRAQSGTGTYTVSLNAENDTLTCSCRGFRSHNHCYHSVAVARWLTAQRNNG